MIGPAEKKPPVRIAGYLEKKGKMRLLVSRWKRWWFVLEGRLLLYYKTPHNLSPCRGSVNLSLASCVQPGKGLELTVVTRSQQSITLRAANRSEHEQWLQALVDAMALPHAAQPVPARPVMYFRYGNQAHQDELMERIKCLRRSPSSVKSTEIDTISSQPENRETSSSSSHSSSFSQSQSDHSLLKRVLSDRRTILQRPYRNSDVSNSARLSKLTLSDTSIPVTTNTGLPASELTDKCQSLQELRDNNENIRIKEKSNNTPAERLEEDRQLVGSRESKMSNSIKIELNLEDIDPQGGGSVREQKIGNIKIVLDGCSIYAGTKVNVNLQESRCEIINGSAKQTQEFPNKRLMPQNRGKKEVKSDTDLTFKKQSRVQSLSVENLQTLDRSIGSTFRDSSGKVELNKCALLTSPPTSRKTNKKRSHSFLSRFLDGKKDDDAKANEPSGNRTIKKSFSFLKNVWKKRERKTEEEDEEDIESNDYDSIPMVIELSSPKTQKAAHLLSSLRLEEELGPGPEPPPDYDISIPGEREVPPMLPPRERNSFPVLRPESPFHDVPRNNRPVTPPSDDDLPPPIPIKLSKLKAHLMQIKIDQDSNTAEQTNEAQKNDSVQCEPPSRNNEQKIEDLDMLLMQLSEVNTYFVQQIDNSAYGGEGNCTEVKVMAEDPDYDIPRPHVSLVPSLRQQKDRSETFGPTHFLCSTPLVDNDSLDPVITRLDAEMTPDSLECDSQWSLTQPSDSNTSHSNSSHSGSLERSFITAEDKVFPDSLNS